MNARPRNIVLVLVAIAAMTALLLPVAAQGVTTHYLTLPAVAFTTRDSATHNARVPICGPERDVRSGSEVRGILDNGQNSWFHAVDLPHGATITAFTLIASDPRADFDVDAWLARRSLLVPSAGTDGYRMVASASSDGVAEEVRQFTDTDIRGAVVNARDFAYFVELESCSDDNHPYAVRITYTTP